MAAGDVNGDTFRDIVTGPGQGGAPIIRVISGQDGTDLRRIEAFESGFTGGVQVAVGDINGDGAGDVIAGTGIGGAPRVRVFSGSDSTVLADFFAYEDTFRGGVQVAAGDVNGDGLADIITGTGVGGGPRVQVFSGADLSPLANLFAYEDSFRGGVLVGTGDVNGDGRDDIITGTGVGGGPRVRAFDVLSSTPLANFFAYEDTFRGGVFVGADDVDGDGFDDILAGTGVGGGPRVQAFGGKSGVELANFFAYEGTFRGGVRVATADFDRDGRAEMITGAGPGGSSMVRVLRPDGSLGVEFSANDPEDNPSGFATGTVSPPTAPAVAPPRDARYVSFNGEASTLQAWEGERVAFLTARRDLDPAVMARIVRTFDRAYDWYKAVTGREPTPNGPTTYNGKATIAVVSETCGAGCGYLGFTGIEIMPQSFDTLYDGVRLRTQYDQVLFYELGRNFWSFGPQLEYRGADDTGAVTTGYAVLMRFLAVAAAGVAGGPFNGRPFSEFRREVEGLVDRYVGDPSLNWGNTLRAGAAPANPMNLGATDLFASFVLRLRRDYGGETFLRNLWREAGLLPEARTTQEASDNFILAASRAAGRDLGGLFAGTWRWAVSEATRAQLREWFPA